MGKYTTYKNLPCELTGQEIALYSQELAKITGQQAELEAEKKEVMSKFAAELKKCLADACVLARKITTGKEDRSIECDLEFDYQKGMVFTVRSDTGVTIDQRKLAQKSKEKKHVKDQTEPICLKAVERNGYALQYVNLDVFEDDAE